MGSARSEVLKFDVQAQIDVLDADCEKYPIYKYITNSNEGKLIGLTKRAIRKNKYKKLDKVIRKEIRELLYEGGNGKKVCLKKIYSKFLLIKNLN